MAETLTVSTTPAANTEQPLVFQSPPVIASQVGPAERTATEGPARSYAVALSSRAAALAGTIGGALVGMVMIGAHATQRTLKVIGGAIGGGIIGTLISRMPWSSKAPADPVQQNHPVTLPNLPQMPTPQPTPHPAVPGTTVGATEANGRMEASQTTQLSV